jgi:hypothetical protein
MDAGEGTSSRVACQVAGHRVTEGIATASTSDAFKPARVRPGRAQRRPASADFSTRATVAAQPGFTAS